MNRDFDGKSPRPGKHSRLLRNLVILAATAGILALAFWLIGAGYSYEWTGFGPSTNLPLQAGAERGKTLWDWLELLIIPVTLLVGGYLLNSAERRREEVAAEQRTRAERYIAEMRAQETALQTYLDQMASLLIEQSLVSVPRLETVTVAKVRTFTVLRRVNAERKGIVVRFLSESNLIRIDEPIINLEGADLCNANLGGAEIRSVDLSGADLRLADLAWVYLPDGSLSNANLERADLTFAILKRADLRLANLCHVSLFGADLHGANLGLADLSGANLDTADLGGANLDTAHLSGARYSSKTIWPDGFDPVQAGAKLVEESPADARRQVAPWKND